MHANWISERLPHAVRTHRYYSTCTLLLAHAARVCAYRSVMSTSADRCEDAPIPFNRYLVSPPSTCNADSISVRPEFVSWCLCAGFEVESRGHAHRRGVRPSADHIFGRSPTTVSARVSSRARCISEDGVHTQNRFLGFRGVFWRRGRECVRGREGV